MASSKVNPYAALHTQAREFVGHPYTITGNYHNRTIAIGPNQFGESQLRSLLQKAVRRQLYDHVQLAVMLLVLMGEDSSGTITWVFNRAAKIAIEDKGREPQLIQFVFDQLFAGDKPSPACFYNKPLKTVLDVYAAITAARGSRFVSYIRAALQYDNKIDCLDKGDVTHTILEHIQPITGEEPTVQQLSFMRLTFKPTFDNQAAKCLLRTIKTSTENPVIKSACHIALNIFASAKANEGDFNAFILWILYYVVREIDSGVPCVLPQYSQVPSELFTAPFVHIGELDIHVKGRKNRKSGDNPDLREFALHGQYTANLLATELDIQRAAIYCKTKTCNEDDTMRFVEEMAAQAQLPCPTKFVHELYEPTKFEYDHLVIDATLVLPLLRNDKTNWSLGMVNGSKPVSLLYKDPENDTTMFGKFCSNHRDALYQQEASMVVWQLGMQQMPFKIYTATLDPCLLKWLPPRTQEAARKFTTGRHFFVTQPSFTPDYGTRTEKINNQVLQKLPDALQRQFTILLFIRYVMQWSDGCSSNFLYVPSTHRIFMIDYAKGTKLPLIPGKYHDIWDTVFRIMQQHFILVPFDTYTEVYKRLQEMSFKLQHNKIVDKLPWQVDGFVLQDFISKPVRPSTGSKRPLPLSCVAGNATKCIRVSE